MATPVAPLTPAVPTAIAFTKLEPHITGLRLKTATVLPPTAAEEFVTSAIWLLGEMAILLAPTRLGSETGANPISTRTQPDPRARNLSDAGVSASTMLFRAMSMATTDARSRDRTTLRSLIRRDLILPPPASTRQAPSEESLTS